MVAESVLATRETSWSEAVSQEVDAILAASELGKLIGALVRKGYAVIGPTVRDWAIVYDQLESVQDLPAGWTDEQAPGYYRLKRREDGALFGYVVGPQSWKKTDCSPDSSRSNLPRQAASPRSRSRPELASLRMKTRTHSGTTRPSL